MALLVEFGSAVNAVQGAIELQKQMAAANESVDEARRIVLRIGINLGDVIGEGTRHLRRGREHRSAA